MPVLPSLIVVVRVTTECPLQCKFCGYSRDLEYARTDIDAVRLVRFGKVLSSYQSSSNRRILVSWLGGEPYRWSELLNVSRQFRQFNLQLGITTNGIALASARCRQQTIELFSQVTVSVDGLERQHDAVRQSPGLFRRLRKNVRCLRAEDVSQRLLLRCNTVLMRSNIDQFERFCEEIAEWGFDELTFNQLGGNDRPAFFRDNRLLPQQVESFARQLPGIQRRLRKQGLVIRGTDQYLRRFSESARDVPIVIEDCRPAEDFLFVSEAGAVSPCSFTSNEYPVPLEDVSNAHLLSELTSVFGCLRMNRRAKACADCHATHVFDKFAFNEQALHSIRALQKNGIK